MCTHLVNFWSMNTFCSLYYNHYSRKKYDAGVNEVIQIWIIFSTSFRCILFNQQCNRMIPAMKHKNKTLIISYHAWSNVIVLKATTGDVSKMFNNPINFQMEQADIFQYQYKKIMEFMESFVYNYFIVIFRLSSAKAFIIQMK